MDASGGMTKRNKRCCLHTLDFHKQRPPGCWRHVWEHISDECREEVSGLLPAVWRVFCAEDHSGLCLRYHC